MVVGRDLIVVLFTQRYAAAWPIFAASMSFLPFTIIVLDPVTRASSERFLFVWLRLAIFLALSTSIIAWSIAVFRMARLLKMTRHDWVLFADLGRVIVATVMTAAAAELVRRLLGPGSRGASSWSAARCLERST